MGHSVETHNGIYVDNAIVNEALSRRKKRWSPGTTTEPPAYYEPIQEMAEVDVDSVAMVTHTGAILAVQAPVAPKGGRWRRFVAVVAEA
eukprot:COSAG02_NODE_2532_length_8593_cov_2.538969_9_plen_89_part_00